MKRYWFTHKMRGKRVRLLCFGSNLYVVGTDLADALNKRTYNLYKSLRRMGVPTWCTSKVHAPEFETFSPLKYRVTLVLLFPDFISAYDSDMYMNLLKRDPDKDLKFNCLVSVCRREFMSVVGDEEAACLSNRLLPCPFCP